MPSDKVRDIQQRNNMPEKETIGRIKNNDYGRHFSTKGHISLQETSIKEPHAKAERYAHNGESNWQKLLEGEGEQQQREQIQRPIETTEQSSQHLMIPNLKQNISESMQYITDSMNSMFIGGFRGKSKETTIADCRMLLENTTITIANTEQEDENMLYEIQKNLKTLQDDIKEHIEHQNYIYETLPSLIRDVKSLKANFAENIGTFDFYFNQFKKSYHEILFQFGESKPRDLYAYGSSHLHPNPNRNRFYGDNPNHEFSQEKLNDSVQTCIDTIENLRREINAFHTKLSDFSDKTLNPDIYNMMGNYDDSPRRYTTSNSIEKMRNSFESLKNNPDNIDTIHTELKREIQHINDKFENSYTILMDILSNFRSQIS